MSKYCEKIHLIYDTNNGFYDELDIYRVYNNCTDTQQFYYSNGKLVTLSGTDSFINCLIDSINSSGSSFNSFNEGYSIKSISYSELPEKIRNKYL